MRFVGCLSHNLEKIITKSSRMAGNADVSRDKNVSLHSITLFKTKGKINHFESLFENEL